jgi:hypothetical protein
MLDASTEVTSPGMEAFPDTAVVPLDSAEDGEAATCG